MAEDFNNISESSFQALSKAGEPAEHPTTHFCTEWMRRLFGTCMGCVYPCCPYSTVFRQFERQYNLPPINDFTSCPECCCVDYMIMRAAQEARHREGLEQLPRHRLPVVESMSEQNQDTSVYAQK
uniref:Uncharacterized protein n=1 Tax=Paramoeba aestuarina TaxID=180227 RepID=A0A7S4UCL2_9EUKA|mmetsp:Transcript_7462/g.11239  ORF Transcript_7462/g.11239 Transcript_7462/m.11239 type:complete len:125 (+) Transcript_7462:202-576(+)